MLCLENLRTLVESNDTLCFHLADIYRGKFLSQHWLQLIAIIFCRQTKICILDSLTYTPEMPISPLEALSVMHSWSCVHMGNRPLRRTIWDDRKAIFAHLMLNPLENHAEETGKWLISQPKIRPSHVSWITYSDTDILQASGTLVLCCPADLQSQSSNYSIYYSRIWTRNHLPSKTFDWHSHLLAVLPHGTLVQSSLPPIHQSLH